MSELAPKDANILFVVVILLKGLKFNKFYKQIAVAYGLGIRFDLDYLILRFDGGMKAINPMETGKGRYPITRPRFSRDFAFHFAVGYPF